LSVVLVEEPQTYIGGTTNINSIYTGK